MPRFDPHEDFPVADGPQADAVVIDERPRRSGGRMAATVVLGMLGALFGAGLGIAGGYMLTHGGRLDGFAAQFAGAPEMPAPAARPAPAAGGENPFRPPSAAGPQSAPPIAAGPDPATGVPAAAAPVAAPVAAPGDPPAGDPAAGDAAGG